MSPKKYSILCVFGTRPEAIKMAPLVLELKKENCFNTKVLVTAQHREMMDQVLRVFHIKPDYDFNIMREGQTLTQTTASILTNLSKLFMKTRSDLCLVHGDTATTFATSVSCFYHRIPCGHVEAGLRTFDKFRPYPEEFNRMVTDFVSDVHFAPTPLARKQLLMAGMGIAEKQIYVTGNTVIDALHYVAKKPFLFSGALAELFSDTARKFLLVTAHRRESFGAPMERICSALNTLARTLKNVYIVVSVHRNPAVQSAVKRNLKGVPRISLMEPVEYETFVHLMKACDVMLTDSGGIQEEAPSLGKPVLVMRDVTERPEAVKAGTVKLVGTQTEKIVKETSKLFMNKRAYEKMSRAVNPYGDGKAAWRTVQCLKHYFGIRKTRPEDFSWKSGS